MSLIVTGAYINNDTPWWTVDASGTSPANILASTLTINAVPNGNILLEHTISSNIEFNAPLIFQRPPTDPNEPSESLNMNTSFNVPTKAAEGEYITATKAAGTAYDDIAVAGLQVYGDQTTLANAGAAGYITGSNGNVIIAAQDSVYISSLFVSSLIANNTVSTTTTQLLLASTIDAKFTLTSTLSLFGDTQFNPDINLGLGDVIQGMIGGAASQGLGVVLGTTALITGATALVTGRTQGGVSSNVFQTVNGSTQLQFSTIGSNVSSVFLTTISPDPFTTPGLETREEQGVAAGTYCVRSVGDPLYIKDSVSSIQMFGQWVPVIQPTATVPALAISSLNVSTAQCVRGNVSSLFVSSVNGAPYPPINPSAGIPSTLQASTITVDGNLSSIGTGQFNWNGTRFTPTQSRFDNPVFMHNTLNTFSGVTLGSGAQVNGQMQVTGGLLLANDGIQAGLLTQVQDFAAAGVSRLVGVSTITISTTSISSIFGSYSNINLSSVNGDVYPPPAGTPTIPSTIALSTVTVNGNFTQSGSGTVNFTDITANNLLLNNSLTVNGQLNTYALSQLRNGVDVRTGDLRVLNGSFSVQNLGTFNNGLTVNNNLGTFNNGLTVASGNTSLGNTTVSGTLGTSGAATFNNGLTVSGGNTSVGNINVTTINNQAYPPPSGTPVIPSTLATSTITVNGNIVPLTGNNTLNIGGALATSGALTVTNGNLTVSGTGAISAFNLNVSGGGYIANLSSINLSTQNINLSTVNGIIYPPPAGTPVIPSTLNASTITVNGNLTQSGLGTTTLTNVTTSQMTANGTLTANGQTVINGSFNTFSGATMRNGLTVETGGFNATGGTTLNGNVAVQSGNLTVQSGTTTLTTTNINGTTSINGSLSVTNGSATFNNGLTVAAGNTSVRNVDVSTINGLSYPPAGPSAFPSTLNASTITVNGNLTQSGTGQFNWGNNTITNTQTNFNTPVAANNTLSVFGAAFLNGGTIMNSGLQVASGPLTVTNGNLTLNGTTTISAFNLNVSGGGYIANLSSINLSTQNINLSTINNNPYPPNIQLPSTLNLSTVNINGGANITNGTLQVSKLTNLSTTTILGGLNVNSGNLNVRDDIVFNDPQGPGYLTGTGQIALKAYNVSPVKGYFDVAYSGPGAQYLTLGNGSQFSQDLQSGNLFTGNIGTYYPQEQTAPLGRVFTNLVSTVTLQANIAIAPNLTASNIIASTINGFPFPQGGSTPTGGIVIWAGGSPINQWAIPAGWLRCDGTEVSKTTYATLFAVIGDSYQYDKIPSTLDMFFLPDLTFAVPMGAPYANTNGTVNGTVNQVPYLKVYFTPWQTDYVNTPIRQCWKIGSVDGQSTAINIGTLFPADGFGAGASGYPNVYVDTILEFDGYVGYIIVCSHDGTTPLPTTNPSPGLEFTARGAGIRADGTYPFQGFNYEGRARTTRTQQMDEVAPHNHHYFSAVENQPPYTAIMYNIGQPNPESPNVDYIVRPPTSVDPVYNRTSFNATNILSTISTVSLPLKVQNIATSTAPNFVNMSYIIKA